MGGLLGLKESYSELKSNRNFSALQDQIEGTENRLSVERKRYNESVRALNTYTRQLLGRTFCNMAGVEAAEYFEIEESARELPKVDFS